MKLLIATGIYPPDIGGPATYSDIIAREFSARGHNVVVVTYGYGDRISENGKLMVYKVSRGIPKGIRHMLYFLKVVWRGRSADAIFAQDPVSAGLPAWCAAYFLRKKFVIKIVGDYAWEQAIQRFGVEDLLDEFVKKKFGLRVELLRRIQNFVARRAERVIVPSNYLKSIVLSCGVESARVKIIPNAVSAPTLPAKNEARRKLGLDGVILLTVGRLVPWKGYPMLFSVISKMTTVPQPQLIIIGGGPQKELLESLRKALKLENRALLTGVVSKVTLNEYLAVADLFLLNTAYEGFSHQIIEAWSAGLPVVTTLAGGNREIIKDGENALVAAYNQPQEWQVAIEKVLRNQTLRSRLINEGKKSAGFYTISRMITETEIAFENL